MNFKWETEYDSADDIPEALRDAAYKETEDGKWKMVDALARKTADLGNLSRATQAARKEAKEAKAKLKAFEDALEGREIEDLASALDEYESLKSKASAFDAGDNKEKIEALVQKRLETEAARYKRDLGKLQAANKDLEAALGNTRGKLSEVTLDRVIAEKAKAAGIKDHSLKFIRRMARDDFSVDDNGEIIDRTEAGRSLDDWLQSQIDETPTLTIDLSNGGSGAYNGGATKGVRTIKRADFDSMAKENPKQAAATMAAVKNGEARLVD